MGNHKIANKRMPVGRRATEPCSRSDSMQKSTDLRGLKVMDEAATSGEMHESLQEERREDPLLHGKAVTYFECCNGHRGILSEDQLKQHWNVLKKVEPNTTKMALQARDEIETKEAQLLRAGVERDRFATAVNNSRWKSYHGCDEIEAAFNEQQAALDALAAFGCVQPLAFHVHVRQSVRLVENAVLHQVEMIYAANFLENVHKVEGIISFVDRRLLFGINQTLVTLKLKVDSLRKAVTDRSHRLGKVFQDAERMLETPSSMSESCTGQDSVASLEQALDLLGQMGLACHQCRKHLKTAECVVIGSIRSAICGHLTTLDVPVRTVLEAETDALLHIYRDPKKENFKHIKAKFEQDAPLETINELEQCSLHIADTTSLPTGATTFEPTGATMSQPTPLMFQLRSNSELCNFCTTTPEPTGVTTTKPTDGTTFEPADVTTFEPTGATTSCATDTTTFEPTGTMRSKSADRTTFEPTDVTTFEPTGATTSCPTDATTFEPTRATTSKPTDGTTFEPTDVTDEEIGSSTEYLLGASIGL